MTREITIAGRRIADDEEPAVIAEVGSNHQGSVETCKRLFEAAATAGAWAVKLQKRNSRYLYTKAMYEQSYTSEAAYGATYGEHREALELDRGVMAELKFVANDLGLVFFATPFDVPSSDELMYDVGVPCFKVASGDLTNTPFLWHLASYRRPLILSTGAGDLADVYRAVETVWDAGNRSLAVMHCVATYPTQAADLNLSAITTLREAFPETVIGLSSHVSGVWEAGAAYALGARIFEKHFTLDRTAKGTDHAFSLEPHGLREYVNHLRNVHQAMGDGQKRILDAERPALAKMGKSLYAARDLPAGHTLTAADIVAKSPGGGVPPWKADRLVGRVLSAPVQEEGLLSS